MFIPFPGTLKSLAFGSVRTAFHLSGAACAVVPIVQLSFLVTVLLAACLPQERLDAPRLGGLALAVGAVFLLSR
ncbi:MAG: hypothetical protein AABZ64_18305 [Nitrospinota bacterium]